MVFPMRSINDLSDSTQCLGSEKNQIKYKGDIILISSGMAVIKKNTENRCFQRGEKRVKLYSAERKENGFYSEEKLHMCASKQR